MAAAHAAAVAGSLSAASARPVTSPRNPFLETPTSMGALASAPAPLLANSERTTFKCASASQFPRAVFAKPMPGSVQTRQGSIPASFAARARSPNSRPTTPGTSSSSYVVIARDCMVRGSPRMCMHTYGRGRAVDATARNISSHSVPPETSLTTSAPASAAAAATAP